MKRFGLVVLMLLVAGSAMAQQGFWIGGGGVMLMAKGSGEWDNDDYDVTTDILDDNEWGLSWTSKSMFGFAPVVGFRINDLLGIRGSYTYLLKKTGEDDLTDGNVEYTAETEWTQSHIQIMGMIYPFRNGSMENFYICAGMDRASFTIDFMIEATDGTNTEELSEDDNGSAMGLIFGGGFDYPIQPNMLFYGQATYSTVKFNDEIFSGQNEVDAEMALGGIALEAGLKFFFNN
ncbi:porin family protein [bacterium]|nr:porin family protein [bacterium]